MGRDTDLLQGTLDLLILKSLDLGPMHGFGVSLRIQALSRDILRVLQGSLYPALHRLEHQGLIQSEWGVSDNGRRAKFYALTVAGRRRLRAEQAEWRRVTQAVDWVLAADRA
ncbi:MAG: PadR family transcriptional regulator [Gemmatimonadales bacterium]